jgi:hypothetical protein
MRTSKTMTIRRCCWQLAYEAAIQCPFGDCSWAHPPPYVFARRQLRAHLFEDHREMIEMECAEINEKVTP